MTVSAHVAAMQDRARQLRVGDWVVLEQGLEVGTALPGREIAAVRRVRTATSGVEIALRLDGGQPTDWIDAARCPAVHDSASFLGHRFRAAVKACKDCGNPYPLSDYYRRPGARDGRQATCRRCFGAYTRSRYQARKAARAGEVPA